MSTGRPGRRAECEWPLMERQYDAASDVIVVRCSCNFLILVGDRDGEGTVIQGRRGGGRAS